jgi:hypothetical protein
MKRIAATTALSILFFVACAPAPEQSEYASDRDATEGDESNDKETKDEEEDEDCVEEEKSGLAGLDIASLEACECAGSHCVGKDKISESFSKQLDVCDEGVCVPDSVIKAAGAAPKTCKSVAGEGRCMSTCVPAIGKKKDVLDRGEGDVCEADELCVPCLNPLEGNKPTGVCEIGKTRKCAKKTPSSSGSTSSEGKSCPHAGKPIDVSSFPACGTGGRCVPEGAVSEAQRPKLEECDGGLCAPEKSVANAGNYLPPTCTSVGGAEGRCLSTVIKDIAAKKGQLPQSTCEANELCAPCFNPSDGSDTGACRSVSCDAPKTEPKKFAECCDGKGRCVPESSVTNPAQRERLDSDGCSEDTELCAPAEDIGRTAKRPSCNGTLKLLGKPYVGACVSRCTSLGLKGKFLDQATCDGDHICAPCTDPTSGESTGACD